MTETHAPNESTSKTADTRRTARVHDHGVAVWVSADDLADLGIDAADTDTVDVRVDDGAIRLVPTGGDNDE
jgi:hypothetical protein